MIIGLDVGGTHTDVVLLSRHGLIKEIKVVTDPVDLFKSVVTGIEKITQGIDKENIRRCVLSTTLTTNAVVQSKLSKVGLIVSSGPGISPEEFKITPYYFPVEGSIDHRGREIKKINPDEIAQIKQRLLSENIKYVGVVGKFSVRNPGHELNIKKLLGDDFEHIFLGHEISGNLNFPRRIATTYLNACVYPIHKKFYEAVQKSLEQIGLSVPIYILKSDGGTMSFDASIDFPGQTILSGPSASIMGSLYCAPPGQDVLVLDIGGTTTDMAILIDKVPLLDPLGISLGNYKTLIRSLYTQSIGIGGDSCVSVENQEIKVGPIRLGPAMAYGGKHPTPTDAIFILENLDSGDLEKARQGIGSIADKLGKSLEETAYLIFDQACSQILLEAKNLIERINSKPVYTVHELQEGYQVNPKKILVLGGPAMFFAKHIEKISDYTTQLVPKWHVANAIGAGLARTTCEVNFFADTEQGIATAPGEKFSQSVDRNFSNQDAIKKAYELLNTKAIEMGAVSSDLEMETIENLQFNMVRGFYTTGRNIRVKVQIKPGLIREHREITQSFESS